MPATHPAKSAGRGLQILTPDRRLRVFVSSSLGELPEERAAVKAAVESLHLTPIMFELGARPHPPRSVYRAYLDQSEVFVGVYWQSGGWQAPKSERSGLEDEYDLARLIPKLIYVKEPAPKRDRQLAAMLEQIRSDADVSYRPFASPDELTALVADDLAVLISERFQSRGRRHRVTDQQPGGNLPAADSRLVDRSDELGLVTALLADHEIRLTALTGPGGVGKSRIAVEAGRAMQGGFRDGAWLVPLASIRDPSLVASAILDTLQLPAGGRLPGDALEARLHRRQVLLILDNFEQALPAAPYLAKLLAVSPELKILVTSRSALHLRAEHEVPISPLTVPRPRATEREVLEASGVQLFLDRARAVSPVFSAGPADLAAVAEIVRRLDGLPLAIELAAARCRVLSPKEVLEGLIATLDLGGGGPQDLPARQRTLRATLQWSYELLDEPARSLLARLSVFRGGFTVEGVEAIAGRQGSEPLDSLETLVSSSLIQRGSEGDRSRYQVLEIVGEFAEERLAETGLARDTRALHAAFMSERVASASAAVFGPKQKPALRALERDCANALAAMDWYLEAAEPERLAEVAWEFWPYWWFYGRLAEGGGRARTALEAGGVCAAAEAQLTGVIGMFGVWQADAAHGMEFLERSRALFEQLGDIPSAARMLLMYALGAWAENPVHGNELLTQSRGMFAAAGDAWGLALAANVLAWLSPELDQSGKPYAYAREALSLAEAAGDDLNLGMALGNLGTQERELGLLDAAREHLAESIRTLSGIAERYAIGSMFASVAQVAALSGESESAVQLLGASASVREWLQIPVQPAKAERYQQVVSMLQSQLAAGEFDRLFMDGQALDYDAAVGLALAVCEGRHEERKDLSTLEVRA